MSQAIERRRTDPGNRAGELRQVFTRADAGADQMCNLIPANPRNLAEVIDRLPVLVAVILVAAERAIRDRVGIRRHAAVNRADEPGADDAEIRREIAIPEAMLLAGAENQPHPFRVDPLERSKALGIKRELQQ